MTDQGPRGSGQGNLRARLGAADSALAALQSDHPQLRAKLQEVREAIAAAAAAPEEEAIKTPPAEEGDPTA